MPTQPNYYNIKREYALKFFQVPKVFMTSEKYKRLSAEAKLAFAILSDRLQLSIKNKWFDKNGNIYFVYTGQQLAEILGCSQTKVTAVKNELKAADLLLIKRNGQGRAGFLYLLEPEITDNDVYGIDQLENNPRPAPENELPVDNSTAETLGKSRMLKNGILECRNTASSDTDISDTELLKNRNPETIKTDTIPAGENSIESQQDAALFENHLNNDSIFTKQQLLDLKLLSSNDFATFLSLQQIVLRAKKQALNRHKIQSSLFDLHDVDIAQPIHETLMRIVQKLRLSDVSDLNNYVFSVIFAEFEKLGNARCINNAKLNGTPLFWS